MEYETKKVLIIGDSHAVCIANALNSYPEISCSFIRLTLNSNLAKEKGINPKSFLSHTITNSVINLFKINSSAAQSSDLLKKKIYSLSIQNKIYIILMPRGNAHTLFGLLHSATAFNTILDEEDVDFNLDDEYIIPKRCIESLFFTSFKNDFFMDCLAPFDKKSIILIPPPPPPEHLTLDSLLETAFTEQLKTATSISSPIYRYKLWRIYSDVYRKLAHQHKINFFEIPADLLEKGKFLSKDHFANTTHANAQYGNLLVRHLISMFSWEESDL